MRLRMLAAAAAILLPVVGAGSTALAGEGTGWKKFPVTFTATGTVNQEIYTCNANNQCLDAIMGDDGVFAGDLQGKTMVGSVGTGNAGGIILQTFMVVFTGTVKGCGTGSLTFMGTDRFDSNTSALDSNYVAVPDFGTGDLAGVTASIHQDSIDQTLPIHGWVRCKVKGHH